MIDLGPTLQDSFQFARQAEHSQLEAVRVISDGDISVSCDANSDGEVGEALSTNLADVITLVVEDLDTVCLVVADEDLHVVHTNSIRELKVLAGEPTQDGADHVEDDHPHHLALHHHDRSPGVDSDASGMLQDVGTKLTDELTKLREDLNLKKIG